VKQCPKCKREWPDTGRFCPLDGAPLALVVAEEQPTKPMPPVETTKPAPVEHRNLTGKPPVPEAPTAIHKDPPRPVVTPVPAARETPRPAVKEAPKPAVKPAPAPAAAEPAKPAKKGRSFSETKWFMIGEQIKNDEVGPEDVPVESLQQTYRPTQELPPEVRKKFSLTYGTQEDESKDK
jgi:hypothetical protein